MIQIDDVLISLDLLEKKFCCDLDACHGACCIEGDAGAPLELDEVMEIEDSLDGIWDDLSPKAQEVIRAQGVAYTDDEGDLVTSIVDGKDCVFTCYDEKGCCWCALERAYREKRISFCKPISCYLYPARIKDFGDIKGVNYHEWDVCKAARLRGEALDLRVYEFLREPLTKRFGKAWYDELCDAVMELKEKNIIK